MLYKEAYSPIHTKVKLSSDLEFRNEFKLFPRQLFEIKISCFSYFFFAIIKIKTFGLMNFLNTATLIFIYQMLVAK